MFGKVKQYLGIEGVKVELDLPENVTLAAAQLEGSVRLSTMHAQTVTALQLKLVERYERGRADDKKVDEYTLGSISLEQNIDIPSDVPVEVDFQLPFEALQSEVDDFANRNRVFKGLAKMARRAYSAKSVYYVIAEAKVKGTALSPFKKQEIKLV